MELRINNEKDTVTNRDKRWFSDSDQR